MEALSCILELEPVRLVPLADEHIEPLRKVCRLDQEIWDIYPVNLGGDGFDKALAMFRGSVDWANFAVIDTRSERLVGLTNYIRPTPFGVVEIGGTYIEPKVRGGPFNRIMKKLLIEHAFASGFHKVEFRVDTRNTRSQAAVLKLGAQQEGILRQNMVTWTGYRRDTAVFGLLEGEWGG
ncbi:MAG: GNAT family protein [Pseudomonadota bacterium]